MIHAQRTLLSLALASCAALSLAVVRADSEAGRGSDGFRFAPLPASAPCVPGGAGAFPNEQPFILPPGYAQFVFARELDGGAPDQWDMNTQNETGPQRGRFLYRTHETTENAGVSVTDLRTGTTRVLARRVDWNRFDGIVWTPWRTLLAAEEMRPERLPSLPDPTVPFALAGLVYEFDPVTGAAEPRPALGAKAHEGIRFDPRGNVYGISETAPTTVVPSGPRPGGYIFKFVPDRPGDLSTGQLFALKIVIPTGDKTGWAVWLPLDRAQVQVDADAEATRVGATGYARPEDVEIATSTGNDRHGPFIMYVAVTDEHRVLRIDLLGGRSVAFVSEYVRSGGNAPADFNNPDNLALDRAGTLFITEDTNTALGGNDIWAAFPARGSGLRAARTVRFASLTDCAAEPSGIYFDLTGTRLFVNVLHRGGADPRDLGLIITRAGRDDKDDHIDDDDR